MGKYFTIKELYASDTAKAKHIDNTPNAMVIRNLENLIAVLDQIRAKYGKPIYVNSGYRCPELNTAVKGKSTSQHLYGEAVDLDTRKGKEENKKLFNLIKSYFPYDQLIDESDFSWVHWSYIRPNRKQTLTL